jgi:hypothetical protein
VSNATKRWLAGTALSAAAIMGVTGIAAGQAAPVSQAHQASYAHHQVVPGGHRTVGTLRLTHFMPDTQPSVQLVLSIHFMPDTSPSVQLVLFIHSEDRSAAVQRVGGTSL